VRIAALLAAAGLAVALWWRRHPSACPYAQRFWVEAPHPLITRDRLLRVLDPRPGERVAGEEALVDAVARAVVEPALLPLLLLDAIAPGRVDHDQLVADAAGLVEEALALVAEQVAVEVTREHAVEGAVRKGQRERVADDGDAVGQPPLGERDHRRALVEPDDEPAQATGEKAGAAGDVERALSR